MSDLDRSRDRYENDIEFKVLVDWIRKWYEAQDATPSDVRAAAHLAMWMTEMNRVRPMFSRQDREG